VCVGCLAQLYALKTSAPPPTVTHYQLSLPPPPTTLNQASRETVDRATQAFRSLGPSNQDELEADRLDAQRQLEQQMEALSAITGAGMGRAAREAGKQRQKEQQATAAANGGVDEEAAAAASAGASKRRAGGGGGNPFALSAEERARWDADEHQYTDNAASKRSGVRRPTSLSSSTPKARPQQPPRRLGDQGVRAAAGRVDDDAGDGEGAVLDPQLEQRTALGSSVRGRLGLAGGAAPVALEEQEPAPRAAAQVVPSAGAASEPQQVGSEDWDMARSEMLARGDARRARREAAIVAERGGKPAAAGAAASKTSAAPAAPQQRRAAAAAAPGGFEAVGEATPPPSPLPAQVDDEQQQQSTATPAIKAAATSSPEAALLARAVAAVEEGAAAATAADRDMQEVVATPTSPLEAKRASAAASDVRAAAAAATATAGVGFGCSKGAKDKRNVTNSNSNKKKTAAAAVTAPVAAAAAKGGEGGVENPFAVDPRVVAQADDDEDEGQLFQGMRIIKRD